MRTISEILTNFNHGKSYLEWISEQQKKYHKGKNTMSNLELVSYKEYPNDQYTKAVCVICINGLYNVAYGKKAGKDGKSWWAPASISVSDGVSKEYVDGFSMDSVKENTKLLDFVKAAASDYKPTAPVAPKSMDEVADAQGLPF